MLTEALGISLLGALGGVLLAFGLLPVLVHWLPDYSFPREAVIGINLSVLGFSVALAIASGVVSGLAPAFQFSKPHVAQLMTSSSRRMAGGARGKRTHNLLGAGQIALTMLLLTSAAAAVNGFVKLVRTDLGYDPHNTMSVGIPVHQNTHGTWADRSAYFGHLLSRIQALPEVVAAGIRRMPRRLPTAGILHSRFPAGPAANRNRCALISSALRTPNQQHPARKVAPRVSKGMFFRILSQPRKQETHLFFWNEIIRAALVSNADVAMAPQFYWFRVCLPEPDFPSAGSQNR